jgi:hypothetical protein
MKRMPGGSGSNPFAQLVEDAEGLDKIEALQVRDESFQVLRCAKQAASVLSMCNRSAAY